ncbi:MAG: triphosphoribosyl-dephospho-CoA synthase [Nitrososphaerota archaeon]|nr:triphosphoribosyl-dephospho-CoA synthase [Candidatus Bathyarchaeota archaeon]MDW8024074.1 triphosphoribosyl-dephospho-CoA synthase [Nitrososphaerota archaeon]
MVPPFTDKATHIAQCLELAILLEVSADKPGNVNLVVGFEGTNHAHFLASAVAAAPHFRMAAERGIAASKGKLSLSDVGVGPIIRNCIADINAWQRGGNTLLGTIILLVPMASAAGMTPTSEGGVFEIPELRRNLRRVVESTTPEDAVAVYEAIAIAKPSGLGKAPDLDVNDPGSVKRIRNEKISLYQVFKIASGYDMVCSEWVNNYAITFDFAYPKLASQIKESKDLNVAVIHTFLEVLSAYPDTFIARKAGIERARWVSAMAAETLKHGGLKTAKGKKRLSELDYALRRQSNILNPGTTADIIAAALALNLLTGYKP